MKQTIIIGAGLTGLSAAYHLEQKGFFDYKIFEKEMSPGGLCRSIEQDGFTFDFTGHLLHINDPHFKNLIETIVGIEQFNAIDRQSFIYSHGTYSNYPFQINLFGLPPTVITECILGYINRNKTRKKKLTFMQWVLKEFGSGFGRHFFFPYQEKIFAYDINKISASWTGRFVPSTSLEQILDGAFNNTKNKRIGYNAQFFYPKRGGNAMWVKKFAEKIRNPINTNFCVKEINTKAKTITFSNGHTENFETLITTIPLDNLLDCLQEKSSTSIKRVRKNLLCNSITNFNLGIKRPNLSDKHWVYFPEKLYPFYRIGFPHNFSRTMTPKNCSSLYGEFSHINKSHDWIRETLKKSLTTTKNIFNISSQEIITEKIISISHAYVIYDAWRDKHVPKILSRLQESHVHSVGRYGEWKYSSMQEAVMDGKKIADLITILPTKKIYQAAQSKPTRSPSSLYIPKKRNLL